MKRNESFVELSPRQRIQAILDQGSFTECLSPFARLKSPHLLAQGIVPQCDDGIVIAKGSIQGQPTVVISFEGGFQGGGLGEISGAKFAGALELVLQDNRHGMPTRPVIIYDTGGVRLQEANYGLLAIAEIASVLVELRQYQPVIGVIPGKVGCFGGMSITAGLCSYLIMTREGRLTLNGPEVIEQEAGILEFDASDKGLIWDTIGGYTRVMTGLADVLVEDDVPKVLAGIKDCWSKGIPVPRTTKIEEHQTMLATIDPHTSLCPKTFRHWTKRSPIPMESSPGDEEPSRGRTWFQALTNFAPNQSLLPSVLCADSQWEGHSLRILSVVPDGHSRFPRARKGEIGVEQGWELARCIREAMAEDQGKQPRAIVAIVDVPSQAYGYKEELLGLFLACSAAVDAYASARLAGHPVLTLIVGNAISGAFLAHGLQGSYMLALDDERVTVHAMGKKSAARITKRSVAELEEAAKNVPGIAYDIHSFDQLGAVNRLLRLQDHDNPTKQDVQQVKGEIVQGLAIILQQGNDLSYRLKTEKGQTQRGLSVEIRERLRQGWS